MFPGQFAYHRPGSVQEAVALLAADPDAKLIAGGHSLLPAMKMRLAAPSALVDLGKVPGLSGIKVSGDNVVIGAMTTYRQLQNSSDLASTVPLLASSSAHVGDQQVRARGTLGGSLAHSDPAADLTAVFLVLNGSVKAVGGSGERTIAADDLFVDLLTTSLNPEEIITEVHIPKQGSVKAAYEKIEHPASGYAVVGVAVAVTVGGDGTVSSARIAVTGCTSKATRSTAAENALTGKKLDADGIAAAAAVAADGLEINGDHYASAEYRAHLVGVATRRALEKAAS